MYGRNTGDKLQVRVLAHNIDLQRLHCLFPERYPFLLQSTAPGPPLGRFDILFAFPGNTLELAFDGSLTGNHASGTGGFLAALDDWWRAEYRPGHGTELPFTGGWFLYLGYELAAEIEPTLRFHADAQLPRAFAVRCPAAIVYDHTDGQAVFVAEESAQTDFEQVLADIEHAAPARHDAHAVCQSMSNDEDPPQGFLRAVSTAKDYIAAGDIYQANLSRRWTATMDDDIEFDRVYRALCSTNPAPFAGMVRWRNTAIVSSSPERLLQIRNGIASTRPIAGTRPRSDDHDLDDSLSAELFAHAKERAEHVMLIDLERNDLGRICEPGTVEVDEMMVLESYAHVHHIVSNVRGRLRADVSPGEAIRAVFPGGTITGCPKVRCMQIINELEGVARGAYTGSFGYLNRDGSLDLNILIRTMVVQGNTVTLRAGSGIVADSDPEAELAEARAKAEGLLRALRQ